MAIGTPTTAGTTAGFTTSTTPTIAVTAATGDKIILIVGGVTSSAVTVSSVSGGGLSWALDKAVNSANGYLEFWSAHCAGAVSGQTITVTLSAAGLAGLIGAIKCSGLAASSYLDGSGAAVARTTGANSWSTGNATTTNADDLILAAVHGDFFAAQTNTPTGTVINSITGFNLSSAQDNLLAAEYAIVSATQASIAGTGNFAGGSATDEAILVAYMADTGGGGGGGGEGGGGSVARPGRHRGRYPARGPEWF